MYIRIYTVLNMYIRMYGLELYVGRCTDVVVYLCTCCFVACPQAQTKQAPEDEDNDIHSQSSRG